MLIIIKTLLWNWKIQLKSYHHSKFHEIASFLIFFDLWFEGDQYICIFQSNDHFPNKRMISFYYTS